MQAANAVTMAQRFLLTRLPAASTAVDATAGNGHDTLFLAQNTPPEATVWAFDIQAAAFANTRRRLAEHGCADKVRLVADSHVNVDRHVTAPPDAVMFNLGYLPGADHTVTTLADTTLVALARITGLLNAGGMMTIVAYPGHPAGQEENAAVAGFLRTLPQKQYTVSCWAVLNQKNNPPVLYLVEKRGDKR